MSSFCARHHLLNGLRRSQRYRYHVLPAAKRHFFRFLNEIFSRQRGNFSLLHNDTFSKHDCSTPPFLYPTFCECKKGAEFPLMCFWSVMLQERYKGVTELDKKLSSFEEKLSSFLVVRVVATLLSCYSFSLMLPGCRHLLMNIRHWISSPLPDVARAGIFNFLLGKWANK